MNKTEFYKTELSKTKDIINYLRENSNLPGPRSNLELLFAFAETGDEATFKKCLSFTPDIAPVNSKEEFLATCGAAGLGKLIVDGQPEYFKSLRILAADERWRVREGVAFALQTIGKKNFELLIDEMNKWKQDNPFVKRAVVAGLCEPILLKNEKNAQQVLTIVSDIIISIKEITNKKAESFRVLKKGTGYGLSVVMAAYPEQGKTVFEKLADTNDNDILWILKENLKKNRLLKMDADWVEKMKIILSP